MRLWNKIKSKIPTLMLGGFVLFGQTSDKPSAPLSQSEGKAKPQTEKVVQKAKVKNPVISIAFQTDTIDKQSSVLLYNQNGKIYRHYQEGGNNSRYRMRMYLFVHEDWHSHNLKLGFKDYGGYSPQQYRNLIAHDEISANLASLNALILEYTLSDNKKEFLEKYSRPRSYFSFYFKEVKNGNIDPFSTDKQMNLKDYGLRVNGMINRWMDRSFESYAERQRQMVFGYVTKYGLHKGSNTVYRKTLENMYFMGGIDFWKFADKDIDCNDIALLDNLRKIKVFPKRDKKLIREIRNNYYAAEKVQNDAERLAAVQHIIIASEIKKEMRDKHYEVNPNIVTILYNKAKTKYLNDKTFADFAAETAIMTKKFYIKDAKNDSAFSDFIANVYNFNGENLSLKINDFDALDVPYKENKSLVEYNKDDNLIFDSNIRMIPAATLKEAENENKAGNMIRVQDKARPRRSGVQYIEVPNFYEPILIDLNQQHKERLQQMFKDFYNLPEVRKEAELFNGVVAGKSKSSER